ncbi:hypothetical protein [Halobacteriovorax sp. ZH1_bin.1]|uniref:hypothetical protein n=1 Tax=Halobacteriovorax sp. ZH1_bin.1 TaxID=3157723 RepID=UPI00371C983A
METEVTKVCNVSKQPSTKLPDAKMNLSHLMTPTVFASITAPAIISIAKILEPNLYKKISHFNQSHIDDISNEIRRSEPSTNFTNTLATIYRMDSVKDIERFHAEGFYPLEDEMNPVFLSRMFSEQPDLFYKIALRSAGDTYFEDRAYTIYVPKNVQLGIEDFKFTEEALDLVRERCKTHFKNRNYTDFCELISGNYGQHHGIEIGRGSLESGSAKVAKGKAFFGTDRFRKTDNMFFDRDTGYIWISVQNVNKADLNFYIGLMSELLTGKPDSYKPIKFNFNFLTGVDLETILSTSFGEVCGMKLRSASARPRLGASRKGPYTTGRHHEDCLIKYDDFMENRSIEKFKALKLHALLDASSGMKDVIEIKESSIKTGNQIKESDMMELLRVLGMLPRGPYNA